MGLKWQQVATIECDNCGATAEGFEDHVLIFNDEQEAQQWVNDKPEPDPTGDELREMTPQDRAHAWHAARWWSIHEGKYLCPRCNPREAQCAHQWIITHSPHVLDWNHGGVPVTDGELEFERQDCPNCGAVRVDLIPISDRNPNAVPNPLLVYLTT